MAIDIGSTQGVWRWTLCSWTSRKYLAYSCSARHDTVPAPIAFFCVCFLQPSFVSSSSRTSLFCSSQTHSVGFLFFGQAWSFFQRYNSIVLLFTLSGIRPTCKAFISTIVWTPLVSGLHPAGKTALSPSAKLSESRAIG